ncbi:MAG: HAD-IB family hydrolase [Proteobacteria bacterium]|nr:HAD-IB family hydrolase [Pseudomonadota bacterium]
MASKLTGVATGVAIFDLDGTLTFRDTFAGFIGGFLRRHPARLWNLWPLPGALAAYGFGGRDRGLLKSRIIRAVLRGERRQEIEGWAAQFAAQVLAYGMRREALAVLRRHRQQGDLLVLLSASPDLYVPEIGRRLGTDRVICTQIRYEGDRLEGGLVTPNRRGVEKLRCLEALRGEFPAARFSAYGNATSDLAHLAAADSPLLVNANSRARRQAAKLGVAVGDWR